MFETDVQQKLDYIIEILLEKKNIKLKEKKNITKKINVLQCEKLDKKIILYLNE